jgi:CheY-like chemotaxis protein
MLILNDILDVSKIEAGKIELEKIPFDIIEVFNLCRLIASPNAKEKGLTLFSYAEPSVGKLLLGDPTRLRQILLNLLSNAIKFTNNGIVKLLAAISVTTKNTVTMHFEVKDSGIGMTEDQIDKVFHPFIQADDSTTRKYGGTGLGLTIAKSFVELMGGELMVESSFGVGSKFSFDITFETIDTDATKSRKDITVNHSDKPIFDGEILVCEDNELNQTVIKDHLVKIGLKSVIADNGKAGVDFVNSRITNGEKPFDLILMDIHMPEMDGLEASKKMIDMGCKTPIIALTANIMPNDRETYFTSGMVDCLPKPFVVYELWSILLKHLKPVSMQPINKKEVVSEDEQHMEITSTFVKSNQDTYKKIDDALKTGDIKLAHRLVHTLKSTAGLVGMNKLSEAARVIEHSLSHNDTEQVVSSLENQMRTLEQELIIALNELTPIINSYANNTEEQNIEPVDKEDAITLLDNLDSLLASDSFDSIDYIKHLSTVPGTSELTEQVKNMDFKQARKTVAKIKYHYGG